MSTEEQKITLQSNDGDKYELSIAAARGSDFITDTLDLDEQDEDDDGGVDNKKNATVNCLRVRSDCLKNVVAFLEMHKKDPMPEIALPMDGNSFEEVRCSPAGG